MVSSLNLAFTRAWKSYLVQMTGLEEEMCYLLVTCSNSNQSMAALCLKDF